MNKRQKALAKLRKAIARENAKWPRHFAPVPGDQWPAESATNSSSDATRILVYRSRDYLAQIFAESRSLLRLSVNRTQIDAYGHWMDGITWDQLLAIKDTLGYQAYDAVEIYPAQSDIVNVANIRHLWIHPDPIPYAWRAKETSQTSLPSCSENKTQQEKTETTEPNNPCSSASIRG